MLLLCFALTQRHLLRIGAFIPYVPLNGRRSVQYRSQLAPCLVGRCDRNFSVGTFLRGPYIG